MKAYIGPYRSWFGPYQCADMLLAPLKRFITEESYDKYHERIVDFLPEGPFKWIDSFKHRRIHVRIDPYDIWSMDHTLSIIALPMLKLLKENKHGAPFVDDEDVPEHLRSTMAPPKENEHDTDKFHFDRWDWVMDEMIWAHEQLVDDDSELQFHVPYGEDEKVPNDSLSELFERVCVKPTKYLREEHLRFEERKQNGFRLFGKYYQALWD